MGTEIKIYVRSVLEMYKFIAYPPYKKLIEGENLR